MVTIAQQKMGKDLFINDDNSLSFNYKNDFQLSNYYDNLKQAIINRLRTYQGELSLHPNYGSELNKIIGKPGDTLLLSEARQYVREALLQEPRISTIDLIGASFKNNTNKQVIEFNITITPIGDIAQPLNLIYDFFITGE